MPAALKMTMCNIDLFFFLNAESKLQLIIKSRHLEFSGLHDGFEPALENIYSYL